MQIGFSVICNTCKQPLKEKQSLIDHIFESHDPVEFFTLVPIMNWEEKKKKK